MKYFHQIEQKRLVQKFECYYFSHQLFPRTKSKVSEKRQQLWENQTFDTKFVRCEHNFLALVSQPGRHTQQQYVPWPEYLSCTLTQNRIELIQYCSLLDTALLIYNTYLVISPGNVLHILPTLKKSLTHRRYFQTHSKFN